MWHQGCGRAGVGIFIKLVSPEPLPTLYIVIEECQFHDNPAQYGANLLVDHDYVGYKQTVNVYVKSTTLRNGRALEHGGGVSIFNGFPTTTRDYVAITNSKFLNNSADKGGGLDLLYSAGSSSNPDSTCALIKDSLFSYNKASTGADIYARLSASNSAACVRILDVSQSVFTGNAAAKNGGSLSLKLPTKFDSSGSVGASPPLLVESKYTRKVVLKAHSITTRQSVGLQSHC